MKKIYDGLLLASGGLDSTVLAYDLESQGYKLLILFFNYGQHCFSTEKDRLLQVLPKSYQDAVSILDISAIYKPSSSCLIKEVDLWSTPISKEQLFFALS